MTHSVMPATPHTVRAAVSALCVCVPFGRGHVRACMRAARGKPFYFDVRRACMHGLACLFDQHVSTGGPCLCWLNGKLCIIFMRTDNRWTELYIHIYSMAQPTNRCQSSFFGHAGSRLNACIYRPCFAPLTSDHWLDDMHVHRHTPK